MTDLFNDDKSEYTTYIPGEDRKYKTQEDLAKGAYEKDRHIKNIERENAELRQTNLMLREDNDKKANLEEYIDRIKANQPASNVTNQKTNDGQPTPQDLESLFDARIKKYEATKTREQNTKIVLDTLKERYGQNYQDVLNSQVEELGLSKEAVNYLAETAPRAFFKTLGLDTPVKTETFEAPPKRSPHFAPKAEPERTWSYYQDMRKNQPTLYNQQKTQDQMMKDYQRLGQKFEDGDFLAYGTTSAF